MSAPITSVQCSHCKAWITDWQRTCTIGQSGTFILVCPAPGCGRKLRITMDSVRLITPSAAAMAQGYFFEEQPLPL